MIVQNERITRMSMVKLAFTTWDQLAQFLHHKISPYTYKFGYELNFTRCEGYLFNKIVLCQYSLTVVGHSSLHSRYKSCRPAGPTCFLSCRSDSKVTDLGPTGLCQNRTLPTTNGKWQVWCGWCWNCGLKGSNNVYISDAYFRFNDWLPIVWRRNKWFEWSLRPASDTGAAIYGYLWVSQVTLKYICNCDPAEVYSADRSPGHVRPFPTPPHDKYGRIHV